jgi:hypothetical protein
MKKIYLAAVLLISNFAISQVLYEESFETNTNGTNYNTSLPEFTDGGGDFFTRTDGSNITGSYSVTNIDGSFFFAAMDIDGDQPVTPVTLSTTSISVSGLSDVDFSIDLAEDDDGTNQDWDDSEYMHITYSIDGGAQQNLIWVENDGTAFNGAPLIDTDFDGTGDGAEITSVFTTYSENITLSSASTIQFFIETNVEAGDEDIALDNIVVSTTPTGPFINANPSTLVGFQQFVGTPSAEQSFDVSGSNLTNDIVLNVTTGDYEISETSGGTFGNTITLTQSGGVVSATTIYVRLNGTTALSPANGDITLSSTGATNQIVTLEGEILPAVETVFATPSALSGFSHFVGTPSAEQTIDVSGANLTADITVTAPTNYEVSTTSGSGFGTSVTLTQSGGTVAPTTVYIRLNGVTTDYTQVGNIDVTSANATTVQVALDGETLDYTPYDIGEVTDNDAGLSPDSLNVFVSLKGIVHCIDFEDGPGYSFTIIDNANDGINVFNSNDVSGYSSTEGDSITVKGQIGFFNGLTQVFAEEIILETQGNPIQTPTVVTDLDETTESQYVTMENVTFVNTQTNWSTGNVDVTDGNNTFVLRLESASPLVGTPAPNGPFDVTGIGGQFDNSGAPYDAGYQLYPCSINPLCNVDVTTATANAIITANASGMGVSYQWLDCDNNDAPIATETGQSFTPSTSGNYAVEITDGACIDTSNCVNVQVCNVDVTTTTTDLTIEANAAGLTYQWLDCNDNDAVINGETSQSFTATSNGNYSVIVTDGVCADTSECVAINTIGVEKEELSLSLYPNPVQNKLNIVSKGAAIVEVKVISVTGQEVSSVQSNKNELNINTAEWTSGVYFVEVKTELGSKIVKVIK